MEAEEDGDGDRVANRAAFGDLMPGPAIPMPGPDQLIAMPREIVARAIGRNNILRGRRQRGQRGGRFGSKGCSSPIRSCSAAQYAAVQQVAIAGRVRHNQQQAAIVHLPPTPQQPLLLHQLPPPPQQPLRVPVWRGNLRRREGDVRLYIPQVEAAEIGRGAAPEAVNIELPLLLNPLAAIAPANEHWLVDPPDIHPNLVLPAEVA